MCKIPKKIDFKLYENKSKRDISNLILLFIDLKLINLLIGLDS